MVSAPAEPLPTKVSQSLSGTNLNGLSTRYPVNVCFATDSGLDGVAFPANTARAVSDSSLLLFGISAPLGRLGRGKEEGVCCQLFFMGESEANTVVQATRFWSLFLPLCLRVFDSKTKRQLMDTVSRWKSGSYGHWFHCAEASERTAVPQSFSHNRFSQTQLAFLQPETSNWCRFIDRPPLMPTYLCCPATCNILKENSAERRCKCHNRDPEAEAFKGCSESEVSSCTFLSTRADDLWSNRRQVELNPGA